ncbi:MAG: thioredoxin [Nitrospirae bacterium RBG_13_43_8]|nr:MAG: thioredoxin [Nitrospirae bacterium RBG_13_43_8]
MGEGVVDVTSSAWDVEVTKAQGLVMVDFWAPWCAPCRMVSPTVEEFAKEYHGRMKFMKLNTDENSDIASKFNIMGIPTLMFFKDGQSLDSIVGAVPKQQLKAKIDSLLTAHGA